MTTPSWLKERLSAGGQIILDGATGSELERRGVPMDKNAWCSPSVTTHSEVLKSIHKALDNLNFKELQEAQSRHDAMKALKIAQKALFAAL